MIIVHMIVVLMILFVIGVAAESGTNIAPFLTLVVIPYAVLLILKVTRGVGSRNSINR